jgi:dienelactone hydrolase
MKNFIIIFYFVFFSQNIFSSSFYDKQYSKFHNSNKNFTKNSEIDIKDINSNDEIKLTWDNALVRIPKPNGKTYKGSMKDLIGNEDFLQNKFKTIIYLHGCSGIWNGTAQRIDLFSRNGYAVIAPASLARKKYPQSCEPIKHVGGMYRDILKIRQVDAKNAVLNAKKLSWTDNKNIFLVGLSEGGITTATYKPENLKESVSGRVIEGWTCHAGWEEYKGINSKYNEPILSIVAKDDPWFVADYLHGDCGEYLNNNPKSRSVVIDDLLLSRKHGLMHHQKIQKITLDFLDNIVK